LTSHIENRELLIRALREELVGPSPQGGEIDCSGKIAFEEADSFYKPWRQKGTGDEILQRDPPCGRYGVGVLYPAGMLSGDNGESSTGGATRVDVAEQEEEGAGLDSAAAPLSNEAIQCLEEIGERSRAGGEGADPDDFDLSGANKYKPSIMGISFLAGFPEGSSLVVDVPSFDPAGGFPVNGRYRKIVVQLAGKERVWWLRSPVSIRAEFPADAICSTDGKVVKPSRYTCSNLDGMDIRIEVFSRPCGDANKRLVTVCLVNRKQATMSKDEDCMFQSYFTATVKASDGAGHILPYPGPPMEKMDGEEQSLALLYHRLETFAAGHGCAAGWDAKEGEAKARSVSAECLPVFETPSITPDITRHDGTPVEIPMAPLAGLVEGDDGIEALNELIQLYEEWIQEKESEIPLLEPGYHDAANRYMIECRHALPADGSPGQKGFSTG